VISIRALATAIAVPFGFYGTKEWLNSFVYQVEVSPLVFVSAFFLTILIASISIGYRAYSAATKNPVKALRYE